jgi:hypothetical protein
MDLYRLANLQGRANGVGAAGQLAPVGAGEQMDILGAPGGHVAFQVEDGAALVGQDHHRAGLRQEVPGRGHDRGTGTEQLAALVPQGVQEFSPIGGGA